MIHEVFVELNDKFGRPSPKTELLFKSAARHLAQANSLFDISLICWILCLLCFRMFYQEYWSSVFVVVIQLLKSILWSASSR